MSCWTGGVVPIRDALAMAADAHPVLCLFETDGQPLHLARGARLASAAQRLALPATAAAPAPAATCPPNGPRFITCTNGNTVDPPT